MLRVCRSELVLGFSCQCCPQAVSLVRPLAPQLCNSQPWSMCAHRGGGSTLPWGWVMLELPLSPM